MGRRRPYNVLLAFLATLCAFLLIRRLLTKPLSLVVPGSSAIHFSVRTTSSYHKSRLDVLLRTWLNTVDPKQVYIVTDTTDTWTKSAQHSEYQIIQASCNQPHYVEALCCKSGFEFEQYYIANHAGRKASWYCHFDDDIYVNVGALVATLAKYNPDRDKLYLGQQSSDQEHKLLEDILRQFPKHKASSYQFGTGAAFCISSSLMKELEPYLRGSKRFLDTCRTIREPDDVTVGAMIVAVLGHKLTIVPLINTQYSYLPSLDSNSLVDQITISFGQLDMVGHSPLKNVVEIPNAQFSEEDDPTRFLSYHCLLHPEVSWCARTVYHCLLHPKTSWCKITSIKLL